MKPIRLGIVGTGKISAQLCDALRHTHAFCAAAILSRDASRGAEFASQNEIQVVFTDEAAFLSSDIDAVYIATPNCLHAAGAIAAARAGKHVLCEKPIATCEADALRMYEAADECGVVLLEAMRPLHDPFFGILTDNLPRIGRVRQTKLVYCQYSSRYDAFLRGEILRAFNPSYHNAALLDIGVYTASLAAALFGMPRGVEARSVFLENGFEGCGEAILDYGDFTATLTYSKIHEGVSPSIIYGENGALSFLQPNAPRALTFHPRVGEAEPLPHLPAGNNMLYELTAFAALIEQGEIAHQWRQVSLDTVRIMDEIRKKVGVFF
ncbi:MAG: Gfo/Idh/MocA family oxidoreductase [Clostridia bacterium]|nr:Gfo/Idh/MocA family oxidoreductase [Clostridia bacterium]